MTTHVTLLKHALFSLTMSYLVGRTEAWCCAPRSYDGTVARASNGSTSNGNANISGGTYPVGCDSSKCGTWDPSITCGGTDDAATCHALDGGYCAGSPPASAFTDLSCP